MTTIQPLTLIQPRADRLTSSADGLVNSRHVRAGLLGRSADSAARPGRRLRAGGRRIGSPGRHDATTPRERRRSERRDCRQRSRHRERRHAAGAAARPLEVKPRVPRPRRERGVVGGHWCGARETRPKDRPGKMLLPKTKTLGLNDVVM